MANIIVRALKKLASLVLTPLFYGVVKFLKSVGNFFSWYKPFRSLIRASLTAVAGYYSMYFGIVGGAALGSAMLPVIGTVIGGIVGGLVGLLATSVAAFIFKYLLRALSGMGTKEVNERAVIENTSTNTNKYVLSKSSFKEFNKKFNIATGQQDKSPKWGLLQQQMRAVKNQKAKIDFWGAFYWTEEHADKLQQNRILKAIKANPISAVETNRVIINAAERYAFEKGQAADDSGSWKPAAARVGG